MQIFEVFGLKRRPYRGKVLVVLKGDPLRFRHLLLGLWEVLGD